MTDHPIKTFPNADVIDLAGIRIERGLTQYPPGESRCSHPQMVYDPRERRIWCRVCEQTVDAFDAFAVLAHRFEAMDAEVRRRLARAAKAERSHIGRIAAKHLDRAWSGNQMAVACPHCGAGLLPEDFLDGGAQRSREIEIARRKAAKEE